MKIIDIHVHFFPDKIAEKTIEFLVEEAAHTGAIAYLDGTIADLKKAMQEAKIDLAVNQPIATKPSQVKSINQWCLEIQDEQIISFGTIHPEFDDIKGEIRWLSENGIKGIKLHPDYQEFHPDDSSVYPIYEAICEEDMIILFHAGIDIGRYPPVYCTPQNLVNVLDDFPTMKIIASHMGSYQLWDDVERFLLGRELYFDTSYSIDYMPIEKFMYLMEAHGYDKILFGTDSPWKDLEKEVEKISSLEIPEHIKEDIFWKNSAKLLELKIVD